MDSSQSSENSSRSSGSSSRSSTRSAQKESYREDVRRYTAAHVKSGGAIDTFEKKLGELARRYGVTNWEDDQTTYLGIGEGLGDAGVGAIQLATYKTQLARSEPVKMENIQRGFDARQ